MFWLHLALVTLLLHGKYLKISDAFHKHYKRHGSLIIKNAIAVHGWLSLLPLPWSSDFVSLFGIMKVAPRDKLFLNHDEV